MTRAVRQLQDEKTRDAIPHEMTALNGLLQAQAEVRRRQVSQSTGSGGGKMPSEYNSLPFNTGALGVARGPDKSRNSDCQFFIVKRDSPHLNGDYTNVGQVVSGMDVVDAIRSGDQMIRVTISEDAPAGGQ